MTDLDVLCVRAACPYTLEFGHGPSSERYCILMLRAFFQQTSSNKTFPLLFVFRHFIVDVEILYIQALDLGTIRKLI